MAMDEGTIASDDLREIERFAGADADLRRRCIKRVLLGDPLVYVTGQCTVLDRIFYVDRRTYRPSINTARMVSFALDLVRDGARVLDVGTGCGWIAVTTKLEKPRCSVLGVDIDAGALDVARENARRHRVDVSFQASDLVDSVTCEPPDCVIANLPYGSPQPAQANAINAHMPRISLYHPAGPFGALRELFDSLQRRGWSPEIFVEAGSQSAETAAAAIPPGVDWQFVQLDPTFAIIHVLPRR